jgi:hypothetical protein
MLKDRSEEELKKIISEFKDGLKQQQVLLADKDIGLAATQLLSDKVTEYVTARLRDFSIPELMKIATFTNKNHYHQKEEEDKKLVKNSKFNKKDFHN